MFPDLVCDQAKRRSGESEKGELLPVQDPVFEGEVKADLLVPVQLRRQVVGPMAGLAPRTARDQE